MNGTANDKYLFTPHEMQEAYAYNPLTGILTRKKDSIRGKGKAMDVLGTDGSGSGLLLQHERRGLLVHRVAWAIHYGVWPADCIDHLNGDWRDNRITNLREATHIQNMKNRKINSNSQTGVKGVRCEKGRFAAVITSDGVRRRLGMFSSVEEARLVYEKAADIFHGAFNSTTSRHANTQ